jgi:hypothetical protein
MSAREDVLEKALGSSPPRVMSSAIAPAESANGRKRTRTPARIGRRQIAEDASVALKERVFIGVFENGLKDSHYLHQ